MKEKFDIVKIVKYLNKYKADLPILYNWNAKIERLAELDTLTENQVKELNALSPYEKELRLKKIIGQKLNDSSKTNEELFKKLCLWIIKDWGGIKAAKDKETANLITEFLNQAKPGFNRIASSSKVGSFLFPDKYVIYDSRVAYALNWIILSEDAGDKYFPIPEGRNSKISAFDINVLIRLKNINNYQVTDIRKLNNRQFIKNCDKQIFIDKKDAYSELNALIKIINKIIWEGDEEKASNLYYTEMLLFSIADREVIMEIITRFETIL